MEISCNSFCLLRRLVLILLCFLADFFFCLIPLSIDGSGMLKSSFFYCILVSPFRSINIWWNYQAQSHWVSHAFTTVTSSCWVDPLIITQYPFLYILICVIYSDEWLLLIIVAFFIPSLYIWLCLCRLGLFLLSNKYMGSIFQFIHHICIFWL